MRRPGLIIVVACALFAAACGSAEGIDPGTARVDTTPLRVAISTRVAASMSGGSMPPSCVESAAVQVADILVDDLGASGLEAFGVTAGDAYAVSTDSFLAWLPVATQQRVIAAVAGCSILTDQAFESIPGVRSESLACLIDWVEGADPSSTSADAAFRTAQGECLLGEEQGAFDAWMSARLMQSMPVVLSPVDCSAIETVPISTALGFDVEYFEHSLLEVNVEQPVGCTFGNPDEPGRPWVLIYVATQDYQRRLYQSYPPLARAISDWSTLPDLLDVADVYFVSRGSSVERYPGALTAVNQDGSTTAAVTVGDYVLMVSAASGDALHPLTRGALAGAAEALAATLALH